MRRLITALVSLLLTACSPSSEVDTNTFTLSNGVEVASDLSIENSLKETQTKFDSDPQFVIVKAREYFHSRSELKHAWLSLPRNGIATLNIGTGPTGGAKEESLKEVSIRIKRDRLPAGTILSVYNLDTQETLGNYTAR